MNGDFKKPARVTENLWDGVDSRGFLNANVEFGSNTSYAYLLRLSGETVKMPVPVSVNAVDLNGDGLLDLAVAAGSGYMLVYFNSGTQTEPKFTCGEMFPVYLAQGYILNERRIADYDKTLMWRKGPRIWFTDLNRTGKLDLFVGNYRGELLFYPNKGQSKTPDFRQAVSSEVNVLQTKNPWGNLFAPVIYDFDRDGKMDVALGEGSYSANAIHLFLNRGTNIQPKFDDSARSYLAFGNGNEQLAPALVDYNGDGAMDLLVGDREGHVSIYLNPGSGWKPGTDFKFSGYVDFNGSQSLGQAITVYAADLNGDGLFDLIIGKSDGHIAVAYNKGTKTEPKFSLPEDLKGEKALPSSIKQPEETPESPWSTNTGSTRGNPYSYFTLVNNAEDPAAAIPGERYALKGGYFPSPNKVFKNTIPVLPGVEAQSTTPDPMRDLYMGISNGAYRAQNAWLRAWAMPSDTFLVHHIIGDNVLKPGKRYQLSFNVKGGGASKGEWRFAYYARNKHETKQTHGDRGSVQTIQVDDKKEFAGESGNLNITPQWTEVSKSFTMTFKTPELRKPENLEATIGVLEVRASLRYPDGKIYLDNFQLVETR